jgi:Flp pilus assembly pilin Flp
MLSRFGRFSQCEAGASTSEYALILAIMGCAVLVSVVFMEGSITDSLNESASRIAEFYADAGHGQAGDPDTARRSSKGN